MVEDFGKFITAIIADTTPARRIIPLAQVGIKNIVSYGKFKKSKIDSPRENLPPADAVISMKPLAAKPAAAWILELGLLFHKLLPSLYRVNKTANANPVAVIERNILLTSSGDDKSDVGDEDMPEKMAKGVANSCLLYTSPSPRD